MRLFVIFVIFRSTKVTLDILPQLTLVVVFVPVGDGNIEKALEDKGTTENSGDVNRVSLKQVRYKRLLR